MILVDSNVILDIANDDPAWADWSTATLAKAADAGALAINPIVYAEVSVGYAHMETLDEVLSDFVRLPLPYEAGFLAGKAFQHYRRRGGVRTSPMPDFYIGAHAAVQGLPLLTRDPRRYAQYFPTVKLIAP